MPPGDFRLFLNRDLTDAETGRQTSTVGEPAVANTGQQILLTGNWFASRSMNNGQTWELLDPDRLFEPAPGGFFCDQLALYDASRDLMLWYLQYSVPENANTNTIRLAVNRGGTLGDRDWYWWDFQPRSLNAGWTDVWFDYPDMALSDNFLYVTTNVYRHPGDEWTRSVVFKFPLDALQAGHGLPHTFWTSTGYGPLRLTRGARDKMYFASHHTLAEVRVWTWPEDSNNLSAVNVPVSLWNAGDYFAAGPDGHNWLARADPRITGAWAAEGVLGFMWSANSRPDRPNPYVQVARINEETKALINEPDIWSPNAAYAYPDAYPNDRGHVGIALFRSTPTIHPSHLVGILDDLSPTWDLQATRDGTNGPIDGKWGDYVTCRRHSPDGFTWIASGFTLQGGTARSNIEPRVVHFGRRRDEAAARVGGRTSTRGSLPGLRVGEALHRGAEAFQRSLQRPVVHAVGDSEVSGDTEPAPRHDEDVVPL